MTQPANPNQAVAASDDQASTRSEVCGSPRPREGALPTQERRCNADYSGLLQTLSPASSWRADEPLAPYTTFGVGGPADLLLEPGAVADLAQAVRFCRRRGLPLLVLGRGSNLLVRDRGFRGVVIRLTAQCFTRTEVSGSRLRCGAGAKLKQVALAACEHGLSGLEFMEGIPGTLGGALRLNAGAMHGQTFDVVESVDFLDERGEVSGLPAADFKAEYRDCAFFRSHIALAAVLRGEPAPPETIRQRMEDYRQRRLATQPCQASAGCVFKNPTGVPAGRLLEELGLKGTRAGPAVVSAAHANFIVNEGGASAAEILELIEMLKQRVKQQRGIELETEIEVVGE